MADLQFMQPPKLNIQQLLQGAQPPEQDDGRLARIAQNIAQSRAAVEQPGAAQPTPAAPAPQVGPVQPPAALQAPAPQAQPSESSQLSAQLNKLNQPPSLKESIAKAGLAFAPTAIAGLVGGLPAAAGAAQGASAGLAAEQAQQNLEKKSLIEQVQAARQREQQAGEFGQTLGFKREELAGQNTRNINTIEGENARNKNTVEAENKRKSDEIAAANARADADRQAQLDRLKYPTSPEGIAGTLSRMRQESQIPNRPTPRQSVPGVDTPLSPDVEQQRIRMALAEKKATETGDVADLATMVVANPDVLKSLNPTLAGKVLESIAKSGRTLPDPKAGAASDMVEKALSTVNYLKSNMNLSGGGYGAVGAKGPSSLFGVFGMKPLPGTPARDYLSYIDALKSQVTLPNLGMLRGMGRVTDREFKALSDAMTAINPSMSESQFMKELGNIETNLNAIKGRQATGGGAAAQPPTALSGPARYVDNGTTYNIPANQVGAFLKDHPGAKKQ